MNEQSAEVILYRRIHPTIEDWLDWLKQQDVEPSKLQEFRVIAARIIFYELGLEEEEEGSPYWDGYSPKSGPLLTERAADSLYKTFDKRIKAEAHSFQEPRSRRIVPIQKRKSLEDKEWKETLTELAFSRVGPLSGQNIEA